MLTARHVLAPMLATLMLVATACGGGGSADKPADVAPEARHVSVVLADSVPLNLMANFNDVQCYFQAATEVTLRDADGSVVGVKQLPKAEAGGESAAKSCSWRVEFSDVPDSAFYEATVSSGDAEFKATSQAAAGGDLEIHLDF